MEANNLVHPVRLAMSLCTWHKAEVSGLSWLFAAVAEFFVAPNLGFSVCLCVCSYASSGIPSVCAGAPGVGRTGGCMGWEGRDWCIMCMYGSVGTAQRNASIGHE